MARRVENVVARRLYDPEPDREIARRNIAYALVALLIATVLAAFVLVVADEITVEDALKLMGIILAAESGLVGSVMGFYFSSPSPPSPPPTGG